MSVNKRFYWIKLKENFFEDDAIEEIADQKDGAKYLIVYLRMFLKSLRKDGYLARIAGNEIVPLNNKKLAELTKMPEKTVKEAIELLKKYELIEVYDSGVIQMKRFDEMAGSECDSAERVRKHRESKSLQCNTDVTGLLQKSNSRDKSIENRVKSLDLKNIDIKEKTIKETYVSLISSYTENEELKEALNNYVEMRKSMKGFTVSALELNLKELDKIAANDSIKIEIVNQSIAKSWKAFYPIKEEKKQTKEELIF